MSASLRPGDVVTYEPRTRWCHDGWAIAEEWGDRLVLVDTYWGHGGTVVHPETYEVQFNLADYDEVSHPQTWEQYAEADRRYIPRHSGYQTLHLVRKGAEPDLATRIENARDAVREAEHQVEWRTHQLAQRRRELAELEERRASAGERRHRFPFTGALKDAEPDLSERTDDYLRESFGRD